MPYTTLVAGTTITSSWANANVRDQVVTPFATTAARDSAISSPVTGMMVMITSNDALEGVLTRTSANTWRQPWNLPWGILTGGRATTTGMQTGIGSPGVIAVTALVANVNVVNNRLYRITAYLSLIIGTAAAFPVAIIRNVLGNTIATAYPSASATPPGATQLFTNAVAQTLATSTAAVNFNVAVTFSANANNQAGGNSANDVAYILVEDIGPGGAPA